MVTTKRRKFGRVRAGQVRQIILDYGRLHPGATINEVVAYLNAQKIEHPNGPEWNIPRFNSFWNFHISKENLGSDCKVVARKEVTPEPQKVEQIYSEPSKARPVNAGGDRLDLVTIIMASDRDALTKERLISTLFEK